MVLVGVIGGKGIMGKFLVDFFTQNKCDVIVSDVNTKLSNKDLASKCDVIVVSVPINKSVSIIKEIRGFVRKDSLLMDVTSLKSEQVKAMLESKCSVLGGHPMFGPGVRSVTGQTFILCKGRGNKWYKWVETLLLRNKAKVLVCTSAKHDKFMSVIQGLTHFNSIVTVKAMKDMGFSVEESLSFTSPVYRVSMAFLSRILNQDPKLYCDMIIDNPNSKKVLQAFLNSATEFKKVIDEKDKKGFEKFFKESATYLGEFKKKASKESDYLIGKLIK